MSHYRNRASRSLYSVRGKRYFTLLELLLAVVILVVVLSVVSLSFRTVVLSWQNMAKNTLRLEQWHEITSLMDGTVRNIIPFSYKNPSSSVDELCFEGDATQLWAVCRHRINSEGSSGLRFFHLFFEEDKLILDYKNSPFFPLNDDDDFDFGLDEESPAERLVLTENLANVEFSYYYYSTGGLTFTDEWDMNNESYLPLAIMITLEWQNGIKEVWFRRLNYVQEFWSTPNIGAKI